VVETLSAGPAANDYGIELDPGSCPLTHAESTAVWFVATAAALLAGLIITRLVRGSGPWRA
jgi:hypothetical protein